MFALGSPISIFLTTRGDVFEPWWPKEASNFEFPGGAKLYNVYDPTDPVAFRFEPLINQRYSQLNPVAISQRHKRGASARRQGETALRCTQNLHDPKTLIPKPLFKIRKVIEISQGVVNPNH